MQQYKPVQYFYYIMVFQCADGTLYYDKVKGWNEEFQARVSAHIDGKIKETSDKGPLKLIYFEIEEDKDKVSFRLKKQLERLSVEEIMELEQRLEGP